MNRIPALPRSLAVLGLALLTWQAQAAVFELDTFSVTRNNTTIFSDSFLDGAPPPSAPTYSDGTPASYGVFGSSGPESDGLLTLNTANGGLLTNSAGETRQAIIVGLLTNTSNAVADLGLGLKDDDTLGLRGMFNLGVPVGPELNAYGIRFTDRAVGVINQSADLQVLFNPVTGNAEIAWVLQDFAKGEATLVDSATLLAPADADQILLLIDRPDVATKDFFASWSVLRGGGVIQEGRFDAPIGLFDGERFVRAEFLAFSSVPLPGTVWLVGAGLLAGLVTQRRRQA